MLMVFYKEMLQSSNMHSIFTVNNNHLEISCVIYWKPDEIY